MIESVESRPQEADRNQGSTGDLSIQPGEIEKIRKLYKQKYLITEYLASKFCAVPAYSYGIYTLAISHALVMNEKKERCECRRTSIAIESSLEGTTFLWFLCRNARSCQTIKIVESYKNKTSKKIEN